MEVVVSPSQVRLPALGDTVQLVARALDAQGNQVGGQQFVWRVDLPRVASVSSYGFVSAVENGSAVVTAAVSSGVKGSAQVTVEQEVHSVLPSPPELAVDAVGDTVSMTARAVDRLNNPVNGVAIQWRSSDPSVATVTPGGFVTTVGNGQAYLVASAGAVQDSISIIVEQVAVSLDVSPGFVLIEGVGNAVDVVAVMADRLGSPMATVDVQWSSGDQSVATVSPGGGVVGTGEGHTAVVASFGGLERTVGVSVVPVVDWNAVGDWYAPDGNVAHTGFVPVALDVSDFRTEWSVVAAGTRAIRPVSVENDAIAFSTYDYFNDWVVGVMNASTGGIRWVKAIRSMASSQDPVLRNGVVYLVGINGASMVVQGLDAATGSDLFTRSFTDLGYPRGAPVVLSDGILLGAGAWFTGDRMIRLSELDGSLQWSTVVNSSEVGAGWSPSVKDGRAYVHMSQDGMGIVIVDAATGAVLGTIADPAAPLDYSFMAETALVTPMDRLIVPERDRLVAFDIASGSIMWEQATFQAKPLLVANGVVYGRSQSDLEARSEEDGSLLWTWTPPAGERMTDWTIVATDNLIFLSTDVRTHAIHLGTRDSVWSIPRTGNLAMAKSGRLIIASPTGVMTGVAVR